MIDKEKIKRWVKEDLVVQDLYKTFPVKSAVDRVIDLTIEKTLESCGLKIHINPDMFEDVGEDAE